MKSALVAIIAVGASANEYESLGEGQCVDAAGQEVSYYDSYGEGLGANCQSVCDADDECVAFRDKAFRDKNYYVCNLYAPSRSSAPDGYQWGWADLSHDLVTKAWLNPFALAKEPDCMLKKAETAHVAAEGDEADVMVKAVDPYVKADAGTNDCPAGSTRIDSELACQTASASIGEGFVTSLVQAWSPRGCYSANGYGLYYNSHPTGMATDTDRLICTLQNEHTTLSAEADVMVKAVDPYVKADARTNDCPAGSVRIESELACQTASASIGEGFVTSLVQAWSPRGCYSANGYGIYYNSHPTGMAADTDRLICAMQNEHTTLSAGEFMV